jgi:NADH-quinone oxidoreductase subunit E
MATLAPSLPRRYVYRGDPLAVPPPAELAAILDRYRGHPDGLITVLEEIQEHYGYLPRRALEYVARALGFPAARVYGVATFYNLFRLNAPGRYQVRVCTGTACHVNHSADILAHLKERLGVGEEETTPDGLFTLETVACTGACSLAPVVAIGEQVWGHMTPDKAWEALATLRTERADSRAGVTS